MPNPITMRYSVTSLLGFICLLCAHATIADQAGALSSNDRLHFDIALDSGQNTNPDLFIPIDINRHIYLGFGIRSREFQETSSLSRFQDSKLAAAIKEQTFNLNLISYKRDERLLSYSLGMDYQHIRIKKQEFGFFNISNTPPASYTVFDNTIETRITGFTLRGDITLGSANGIHSIRASVNVSPANSLEVEQATTVKPLVANSGNRRSRSDQDPSYDIRILSKHQLFSFMSAGIDLQYSRLPLNYPLLILSPDASRFIETTIDQMQSIGQAGIRLVFSSSVVGGIHPVLGVFSREIRIQDNTTGQLNSTRDTLFTLGFTSRF